MAVNYQLWVTDGPSFPQHRLLCGNVALAILDGDACCRGSGRYSESHDMTQSSAADVSVFSRSQAGSRSIVSKAHNIG